jgi:SAM-dependent methyltransferase
MVELEDRPCPFGCPPSDRIVLKGNDRIQNLPGEFTVVECTHCGLLRTNPRPTAETIGFYYRDDYQPYLATRQDAERRPCLAERTERILRMHAIPALAPGRMLEVGCASGSYLLQMARRGWQVQGIEFSHPVAAYARDRGLRVHSGPLESAPEFEQPFDLVTAWMTFEHLHEPVAGLRKLAEWVKPEGWMAFSVPNAAGIGRAWFGDAWFPLHLPAHLFHFTPRTIARLLELSGWQLNRIHFHPDVSDQIASVGYCLRDRGLAKSAAPLISYPWWGGRMNLAWLPLSYPLSLLGRTSRMTVWARKDSR